MRESPLVSIVVPSFNQGRFIRHTIDSILAQSYRPLEIQVVDGASTDETVDVLRSYGETPELHWVSEPDNGVVHAVNKGFERAAGDIIAIQSSDDYYLPGAIETIVRAFRSNPNLGLVYGDTVKVDEHGNELQKYRIGPFTLENLLIFRTWIPQPSAFFRRELLAVTGGWDEAIPYAPDTDLWLRLAFRTEVRKLDEYLSARRVHSEQRDTQRAKIIRDYSLMIERSPDLRNSPDVVRQAAKAGEYLLRVRYNPTGSDWYAAWNLFMAGLSYSKCRNLAAVARHLFYYPIRKRLSRIKRFCVQSLTDSRKTGTLARPNHDGALARPELPVQTTTGPSRP